MRSKLIIRGRSTAPDVYGEMETDRRGFLQRAQEYSRLTLPHIEPESLNRASESANQHGYQSIGAEGANNLINTMSSALFPADDSFFRIESSERVLRELQETKTKEDGMQPVYRAIEERSLRLQHTIKARSPLNYLFANLIISGNGLFYFPDSGRLDAYPLRQFCVRRDMDGVATEIIIKQSIKYRSLDPMYQAAVQAAKGSKKCRDEDQIDLYTHIKLIGNLYHVLQSVDRTPIGKPARVKPDKLPWIPVAAKRSYDEDYGRGIIEDISGDLYVISFLSEALIQGMILMGDIKYLIKPGSVTDVDHLVSSPTGEYVYGNLEDIGVLQLEKYADFRPISEVLDIYQKRVAKTFLLSSEHRRDAERVTAYELRQDAIEFERSFTGFYSELAETLQEPFAIRLLNRLSPELTRELVNPVVVTGIDALTKRGNLNKIEQYSQFMALPASWHQSIQQRIDYKKYSDQIASDLGLKVPFIMADDQLKKQQQAAQATNNTAIAEETMAEEGAKAMVENMKGE